jgi:predicted phage tail protein
LDCAADVPPGTACKGKCEEDVAALNTMIQRGKTAYQKTGKAYKKNSIAILLMGLIFFAIGIVPILAGHGYGSAFMAIFGLVFMIWSFFSYQSGQQIQKIEK